MAYKEYVMDFENYFNESISDEYDNELVEDFEYDEEIQAIDEEYDNDILDLITEFVEDIEYELSNVNESELINYVDLLPLIETAIHGVSNPEMLKSVIESIDQYEEIYEELYEKQEQRGGAMMHPEEKDPSKDKSKFTDPKGGSTRKRNIFQKIKDFASSAWKKFTDWFRKRKKAATTEEQKAKLEKDAAQRKEATQASIEKNKKTLGQKIKGIFTRKPKFKAR